MDGFDILSGFMGLLFRVAKILFSFLFCYHRVFSYSLMISSLKVDWITCILYSVFPGYFIIFEEWFHHI